MAKISNMPKKESETFANMIHELLEKYDCDIGFVMLYKKLGNSHIVLESKDNFKTEYADLGTILIATLDTILTACKGSQGSIIAGMEMINNAFRYFFRTRSPTSDRIAE